MRDHILRRLTAAAASAVMLVSAAAAPSVSALSAANADASAQTDLCRTELTLFPNGTQTETVVTLCGMMPEGATAEAVDVTVDYAATDGTVTQKRGAEFAEEHSVSVLAAYDITISDGRKEFQPDESSPITVTISSAEITADAPLQVWHIPDNGSREQIQEFTLADGAISFSAEAFSVYEIVEVSEPEEVVLTDAQILEELDGNPFYMSITKSGVGTYWFQNYINGTAPPSIAKTANQDSASVWYFEKVSGTESQYRIYTFIDRVKTYMAMTIQNYSGTNRGAMSLTTDETDPRTVFDVSLFTGANGAFYIAREGYGLNLVKNGSGPGFAGWQNASDLGSKVVLTHAPQIGDDPAGLDEKTYGLMVYPSADSGASGAAMMADQLNSSTSGRRKAQEVNVRQNPMTLGALYVPKTSDITMWTFHNISGDQYYITAETDGGTKYLRLEGSGSNARLQLSDTPDASCILKVTQGTGAYAGKIRITNSSGIAIRLHDGKIASGFNGNNRGDAYEWLNLAALSDITENDFVANSAQKVSVSDTENVANGRQVIIYTRVWNPDKPGYDFYIVDHAGRLFPAYEVGDNIEWYGLRVDNLLWDFTEHYYEGTDTPNYYYDLQNTYSDQYLAPLFENGQTLSPERPGINLNGRKNDRYSTTILAWDDKYYQYAGLKADPATGRLVSCPMSQAGDFCFAVIEPVSSELTTVNTIDNDDYSITMRMIDFGDIRRINGNDRSRTQYNVLHDDLDFDLGKNGSDPYPDLISAWLEESGDNAGYPTANNTGKSLSELFAGASPVNHLFLEKTHDESGYFEYDCTNNFAHLNANGDFTVYDQVGTIETSANKLTLKHGQFMPYNDLTAGLTSSLHANETDSKTNPLPTDDPRREKPLYQIPLTSADYFFGMELEASFTQTHSGVDAWGNDMIFEFTGDDDFWLYVDGVRVIDLGGIHSALSGSVNFRTGAVKVDTYPDTTLRAIFTETFIKKYQAEHGGAEPSTADVNAYLADYFEPGENKFKDFTPHKMKVFYMERGAGASNLHMRFNLSAVKPGQVLLTKEVTGSDDIDFALVDYPFQIWYKLPDGVYKLLDPNESSAADKIEVYYPDSQSAVRYRQRYQVPGTTQTYDNVFFLSAGESAYIDFPDNIYKYYIKECGINTEVYESVSCNGTALTGTAVSGSTNRKDFTCGEAEIGERPAVTYENRVDPGKFRSWNITKRLYDADGTAIRDDDSTTFDFRVYLDAEEIPFDELHYAQMHKYRVKNPEGFYCKWDPETEAFVSTGKTDPAQLNEAETVFYTSPNGSVSKIPAWYTVEMLHLPVGTRFKAEEKENETPLGYQLWKYDSDKSTYISVDANTHNMGTVRENESPETYVLNKRGFGIEAEKVWTDSGSVTGHAPVYMAVYVSDSETETMAGAVQQLAYPAHSVDWFFEALADGKTFADYVVREVRLTGARFDDNGNLTGYDTAEPVGEGQPLIVAATPKGSETPEDTLYNASYTTGVPTGEATGVENTRKDTVTNRRNSGIQLMLGEWNGTAADRTVITPLRDGTFTLTLEKENGDTVDYGEFVTDSEGVITLLFSYPTGEQNIYTLTETQAPPGYIAPSQPVKFYITEEDGQKQIHFIQPGSPDGWHNANPGTDSIDAFINIYNKRFTLEAVKYDALTNEILPGAKFALYKGRMNGTDYIKDYIPLDGYDADVLISGADGVIPKIDNTLPAGRYYLTEKEPPASYECISADLVFDVTAEGEVVLVSAPGSVRLLTDTGTEGVTHYRFAIKNARANDPNAALTVTKIVNGSFGNKVKDFTFTLTVNGAGAEDTYAWRKNGEEQTPLQSGGTFTMRHNDTVVISLPKDTEIMLSEDNEGCRTTFRFGDAEAEECASSQFILTEPTDLTVTNTCAGIIPTGIAKSGIASLLLFMIPIFPIGCVFYTRKRRRYAD